MADYIWGDDETQFFYELTPDRILDAVESAGETCTGRFYALNSMENRVYDVEIELDEPGDSPSDASRIVKFYRPGRWTEEQILEEHEFLLDLEENEIPVCAPMAFEDGSTLKKHPDCGIYFGLFPKIGGRMPDELTDEQITRLGSLIARVHNVGASKEAPHRIELTAENFCLGNLEYLLENDKLPENCEQAYTEIVEEIVEITTSWFDTSAYQRIHGDCHFGNILWRSEGATLLDFDDMLCGPCVQDIWLLIPGRDAEAIQQRDLFLEAYESMREFDRSSLRLIEPLRAFRFIHFNAWISKRWEDPAFPRKFPFFGTDKYWREQVDDLSEQLQLIRAEEA